MMIADCATAANPTACIVKHVRSTNRLCVDGVVRSLNAYKVIGSLSWNEALNYVGKSGATCAMYENEGNGNL